MVWLILPLFTYFDFIDELSERSRPFQNKS